MFLSSEYNEYQGCKNTIEFIVNIFNDCFLNYVQYRNIDKETLAFEHCIIGEFERDNYDEDVFDSIKNTIKTVKYNEIIKHIHENIWMNINTNVTQSNLQDKQVPRRSMRSFPLH